MMALPLLPPLLEIAANAEIVATAEIVGIAAWPAMPFLLGHITFAQLGIAKVYANEYALVHCLVQALGKFG
jgi:hypothetical protein